MSSFTGTQTIRARSLARIERGPCRLGRSLPAVLLVAAAACSGDEHPGQSAAAGGAAGSGAGGIQDQLGQGGLVGTAGGASGGGLGAGGFGPVGSGGISSGGMPGGGGTSGSNAGGAAGAGGTAAGGAGGMEPGPCDASAAPDLGRIGLAPVVQGGGLSSLVYAAQPPGSQDWYLVELGGRIMVWSGGALRPTPFLDIQSEVPLSGGYDERGLLSLTFAPDYATSGRFYIALVPTAGAATDHDLVLEYTRSGADPYVADVASRRAVLDLAPRGSDGSGFLNLYHNASTVQFGPDGMLYVGLGDGGGQCNSANPGVPQDIASPYGKILRLDPTAPAPHAAAGNPFEADGDARVWHYGIRNPFRFAFDSATGDLYFGDVGQWDFEEISFAPSGASGLNFGWPDFEAIAADTCPGAATLRAGSDHTAPIYTLDHGTAGGALNLTVAIVGGTVYRGSALPDLYGAYLFGEYYPGRPMGALYHCPSGTSSVTSIRKVCDPNFPGACFVSQGGAPALAELGAIVEGNDGELYLVANGSTLLQIVAAE